MPSDRTRAAISSETATGRAWGTFFFTGFGTLWMLTGLANMHRLTPMRAGLVAATGLAAASAGIGLLQVAKRLPSEPLPIAEEARVRRVFTAVNIIQWVAVATAVVVLSLLRLPEYIVPAIGILVGLHLYPLADVFRYTLHTVTATLLVSWCTICVVLLPKARIAGFGAFGTGGILLLSAIATLAVAYNRSRSEAHLPAAADLVTR